MKGRFRSGTNVVHMARDGDYYAKRSRPSLCGFGRWTPEAETSDPLSCARCLAIVAER